MADETVASLGFEVNSKPLDDAKQKLAEVSTEANKTGKAVDDFNQKVGNTGAAATKAADGVGKVGPALGAIESAANRAGVSVETMRSRAAAFSAETAKLASASVAAGSAIGTIAKEAGAIAPALNAVGAATAAVTKEHEGHSKAIASLRTNLRGMSPLLNQLGGGLGDVLQYARAARLGLEGLALVAGGGLLIALAKVGDEVDRTKNRLSGLIGSTAGGAKAYDAIAAAAKSSGGEFSVLEGTVEKLILAQEKFADKNVIYANTAEMTTKKTEEMSAAVGTFQTMLSANSATAKQAEEALKALAESFDKTGTLTVEAFTKIRDASPSTAKAIAEAFGFKSVKEFIAELDKGGLSLDDFKRRMAIIQPQVATTFDPEHPKTFTQALEGLSRKWNEFVKDLAKKPESIGAVDVLKEALTVLPKILEQDFKDIGSFKQLFTDIGAEWTAYKDKVSTAWHNTEATVETAVNKIISIIARLPGEGIAAITSWASSAIAEFNRMAQGAVSAAQQALSALGSIAKGGGGNGGIGLSGGGNEFNTDATGAVMGGSGGASDSGIQLSPQGTDAGAPNFDLGMADLPAFASGGQFTVAGSGGTDSQVVSFKSTPGEVVTVSTPEQMAQSGAISGITTAQGSQSTTPVGVVSATPEPAALATVKEITDAIDASTIDISKKVLEGSDNIVDAITKLIGGVAATTVNPSTGLPIASTTARTAFGGGGLDGSGFGRGGSGASGGAGGGFSTKGSISPGQDAIDKAHAEQRKLDQQETFSSPGAISRGSGPSLFGGVGTFAYRQPTGMFAPYHAADPMNSGAYDSGMSNFYGTDSGGSGDIYGSLSDIGGGTSDFYATDSSGSGMMSGSVSVDYAGDTAAMDYGGGSYDAGYFATGGSFTVPGSPGSGTDKTLVVMHNTPGETVTVTPNGVNVPSVGGQSAANADPSSQANITNKTVNIHVQAGIQAESFIRSRAMIARGF